MKGSACAAVCLAALAAGCSTGVQAGPTEKSRSAVATLLDLCAKGRGAEIADVLNAPARETFIAGADVREGCERVIGLVPPGASATLKDVFERARVTKVQAHGSLADVEVTGPSGWKATLEAEDEGNRWVVTRTKLPA